MAETPGLDALAAGLRSELGPPVEELNALNLAPERMSVKELLWSATWLQGEVKRLRCSDPIECGHEAALGQVIEERDRLESLLDRFAYKVAPVEVIGEHSSANDPWANALEIVTPAAEVERLTTALEEIATRTVQRDLSQIARTALNPTTGEGEA